MKLARRMLPAGPTSAALVALIAAGCQQEPLPETPPSPPPAESPPPAPPKRAEPAEPEPLPEPRTHYRGREIAQTMHWQGAGWLMRAEREREENASAMLAALGVEPGWTVCDLGCGSGYHTLTLAERHLFRVGA